MTDRPPACEGTRSRARARSATSFRRSLITSLSPHRPDAGQNRQPCCSGGTCRSRQCRFGKDKNERTNKSGEAAEQKSRRHNQLARCASSHLPLSSEADLDASRSPPTSTPPSPPKARSTSSSLIAYTVRGESRKVSFKRFYIFKRSSDPHLRLARPQAEVGRWGAIIQIRLPRHCTL